MRAGAAGAGGGFADTSPVRILIVEDDARLAAVVSRGLRTEGHACDVAGSAGAVMERTAHTSYDVIVLDVTLPGGDGFGVCDQLRTRGVWAPVLMLTARDGVDDRVRGLNTGADDYMTKPFSFAELAARIRALGRRATKERPAVLTVGDLQLDPATMTATRSGVEISLSTKEYALLEALMLNPGVVLSRLQLVEHAWDFGYEHRSNVIDVYIRYLRQKIDRPFATDSIETVRGVGYRLRRG
jgi:two-component system, OmpR family, response regulator